MKGTSFFLLSLILIVFYSCGSSKTIRSGEIWTDTDQNTINAHGGGILYHNGTYYWYGEYKNDSTYHAPGVEWDCYRTEAGGVACYSSKNLQSWKFEGIVLKPDMTDPTSDIHPSMVIERPKVIYNDKTKKFVMWMHIDNYNYSKAAAGVAISDSPTGNFQYLHSLRPGGEESRDMTLFKDEDGKKYGKVLNDRLKDRLILLSFGDTKYNESVKDFFIDSPNDSATLLDEMFVQLDSVISSNDLISFYINGRSDLLLQKLGDYGKAYIKNLDKYNKENSALIRNECDLLMKSIESMKKQENSQKIA